MSSSARGKSARRKVRREGRGKREGKEIFDVILSKCFNRYQLNPLSVNTISILSKTFVECFYELYNEVIAKSRGFSTPKHDAIDILSKYVSKFTLYAVESMYNVYLCKNLIQYLDQVNNTMKEIAVNLSDKYHVFLLNFTTLTRLVIDTRNPWLPFDISISWDPIRNLPYIPSSSLKGVARSHFELNNISIGQLDHKTIFGSEEQEGIVIMSDAYPISCSGRSLIEPDIINPHYEEHRNCIDEVSVRPRPIIFPTIAPGTTFAFVVAIKGRFIDEEGGIIKLNSQEVKTIVKNIVEGLEQGLGAKVSVGYGRIKVRFEDSG